MAHFPSARESRSLRRAILAFPFVVAGLVTLVLPAAAQNAPPRREVMQACRPDYQALCSNVPRGGGRVMACLQQNQQKLSPDCQRALAAAPAGKPGPKS